MFKKQSHEIKFSPQTAYLTSSKETSKSTISFSSRGLNKKLTLTDAKTFGDTESIITRPTGRVDTCLSSRKLTQGQLSPIRHNSKLLDKFNEIFDKKKLTFTTIRPQIKKRVFKTKDGVYVNVMDQSRVNFREASNRTDYEIGQIKTKINFMKCIFDYSYPRIVRKEISLLKKIKNEKRVRVRDAILKPDILNSSVKCTDINKTSSFIYSLERNSICYPKISKKVK
jgi:hypothetical protein